MTTPSRSGIHDKPGFNPADRRESPRIPMRLLIRDLTEGGSFEEYDGDLSVGGALVHGRHPPTGKQFEVRFRLPRMPKDFRIRAELLRVRDEPEGMNYHLRFLDLDVNSELAIAKFIDDVTGKSKPAPT